MSALLRDAPATAAQAATIIRDAAAADRVLRLVGAGTWLDAGHPVRAHAELSTEQLAGITSYRPEDLTLSAGAGTTLAELDAATRVHGQWCPLLPWGDDRGTIGATIATATSGPFAERLGRPRELVLGLECVDGTGRIVAAGGRVVKNVAGFDLTRAVTGSWGTLGLITQVHLRLRARPVVDESWAVDVPASAVAAIEAFARGPFAPLACVMMGTDGPHPEAPEDGHWMVRLGGNEANLAAARAALRAIGTLRPLASEAWDELRIARAPVERALRWRWDPLSRRLRERFDPAQVLNRGLLGEVA
ncbi:MAG: FAD-binding protein [Gemmatimonadetes bacterium]|nr:FAD-binding protein [Gemmatimonadota bacterium]